MWVGGVRESQTQREAGRQAGEPDRKNSTLSFELPKKATDLLGARVRLPVVGAGKGHALAETLRHLQEMERVSDTERD